MDGNQPKQTLLQRFWSRVHDNRGAVVALVLAAGVVGLAQLTHALGSLGDFFWPNPAGEKAEYCDLLTPLIVQLDRTGTAFERWTDKNLSLESEIVREGNNEARRLLMTKAHLVPGELEEDSRRLIEHYDRWAEEYDRLRVRQQNSAEPFVFVGPSGFPFPRDAEVRIRARAAELRARLGTRNPCQ